MSLLALEGSGFLSNRLKTQLLSVGLVAISLLWGASVGCSKRGESAPAPVNPVAPTNASIAAVGDAKAPSGGVIASIRLGTAVLGDGLKLVNEGGDGATEAADVDGVTCRLIQRQSSAPPVYMYFQIDAGRRAPTNAVRVMVDYFDATTGSMSIDYDSADELSRNPAYHRSATRVDLKNDKRWHTAAFILEWPRFEKGQHDGGDFRIALTGSLLFVKSVKVIHD